MTECQPRYEPLPNWTIEEMEEVILRDDPTQISLVPLVAGLNPENCDWAIKTCLKLCKHWQGTVRGNAILGLGYLARTCGSLHKPTVFPIIAAGLGDEDE